MSLPDGFLDELRTRVSLTRVVGRRVTWDNRKSNQAKGDMWAPCPFHQEKTASFHVDDRKGFYYCFGCHAKGDAISFVRETENLDFMGAVELLARDAGMTMPERDPAAREKSDRNTQLSEIMDAAARFFRLQLAASAGADARAYLAGRGLDAAALERFEIGFAPGARQALWGHLTGQGIAPELVVESGLAIAPDDGGTPYDRFRDRIQFPIRDARGRCIAFGGRAMSPDARAKYLNSPETPLFDKGRSLYNIGPARVAAGKGAPLIVAEGYMDVIALVSAGFAAAVAPLGTAITPHQLEMLWRVAPEPVLALDGDTAGLRAARRSIDVALPLLQAGRSLRFALLPGGQDPDDLLRASGPEAMSQLVDAATPLVTMLWQRETEDVPLATPEQRAALDQRLAALVGQIPDSAVQRHYGAALKDLKWTLFRAARKTGVGSKAAAPVTAAARASFLAGGADPAAVEALREATILGAVVSTPEVLPRYEDALAALALTDPVHAVIRDACLSWDANGEMTLRDWVTAQSGAESLERLLRRAHVALTPAVRAPGDIETAALCVAEELAKLESTRAARDELTEAVEDVARQDDDGSRMKWRLDQITQARHAAERRDLDQGAEFDTAPNGAKMNRTERDAFDALLNGISFTKPRR